MGPICCRPNPGAGRNPMIDAESKPTTKQQDARRSSIKPSFAHKDRKLVRDYILGAQLGQGAYGEVRECAHK